MFRTRSTTNYFDPSVLFRFQDIEKPVQIHLKNVYSLLSVGFIAATIGAYLFVVSPFIQSYAFGILLISALVSIGTCLYVMFTENTAASLPKRAGAFVAFALSTGLGLGPLLNFAVKVNPSTVPTALMGTALIFVSFSLASLLTRKRYFVYLGGILGTAIGVMSTFALMNLFIRSQALYQVELYLSFMIFSAFIVYDTQLVVFKRQLGDTDFVRHALDLFVDAIEVFRHLLIILNRKRDREDRRRE